MQCSSVDKMLGCCFNAVESLFRCFCNVQVIMHCSGPYAMFGSRSDVDALFMY